MQYTVGSGLIIPVRWPQQLGFCLHTQIPNLSTSFLFTTSTLTLTRTLKAIPPQASTAVFLSNAPELGVSKHDQAKRQEQNTDRRACLPERTPLHERGIKEDSAGLVAILQGLLSLSNHLL